MTLGWCGADAHLPFQGANASSLGRMFLPGPRTEPCPPSPSTCCRVSTGPEGPLQPGSPRRHVRGALRWNPPEAWASWGSPGTQ